MTALGPTMLRVGIGGGGFLLAPLDSGRQVLDHPGEQLLTLLDGGAARCARYAVEARPVHGVGEDQSLRAIGIIGCWR